jgi:hypothetical protein
MVKSPILYQRAYHSKKDPIAAQKKDLRAIISTQQEQCSIISAIIFFPASSPVL